MSIYKDKTNNINFANGCINIVLDTQIGKDTDAEMLISYWLETIDELISKTTTK